MSECDDNATDGKDAGRRSGHRQRIEDRLSDDRLQALHELAGGQINVEACRNRILTILTRYERYLIIYTKTPKKERRRQLEQIEKRAVELSTALGSVSRDVLDSLDRHDDYFEPALWKNWTFESEQPLPIRKPLVDRGQASLMELLVAARAELADLDRAKHEPRQVKQVALIQLIEDLAALYDTGIDIAKDVNADTSRPGGGGRFGFVKAVLDWYHPDGYFSDEALKQQLKRTLKSDW